MVLSPKAQGLRLSTDGLQARLAQPPHDSDVALFLHTSGVSLTPLAPASTKSAEHDCQCGERSRTGSKVCKVTGSVCCFAGMTLLLGKFVSHCAL